MRYVIAIVVCMSASGWLHGAEEFLRRTAYLHRTDGTLIKVDLPIEAPPSPLFVEPEVVSDSQPACAGSTWLPDGRILTISYFDNTLVALDPADGAIETVTHLTPPGLMFIYDDLLWSPSGDLLLSTNGSTLHHVDLQTGALIEIGPIDHFPRTLELHQGQYFAGISNGFARVDPETLEMTTIVNNPWAYWGYIEGLSSAGGELWYVLQFHAPPGGFFGATIGTIDLVTGELTPFVLLEPGYLEAYSFLEIVEQVTTAPIPELQPVGVAVLITLLALVAVLSVRRT